MGDWTGFSQHVGRGVTTNIENSSKNSPKVENNFVVGGGT